MTIRSVALVTAIGTLALGGGAAIGASAKPAPTKLANPTKTCEQLNSRFLTGLAPGQNAKLATRPPWKKIYGSLCGDLIRSWAPYLHSKVCYPFHGPQRTR